MPLRSCSLMGYPSALWMQYVGPLWLRACSTPPHAGGVQFLPLTASASKPCLTARRVGACALSRPCSLRSSAPRRIKPFLLLSLRMGAMSFTLFSPPLGPACTIRVGGPIPSLYLCGTNLLI